jgi:hypothetical protein
MPVINPTPSGPIYPDGSGPCAWPIDTTCCTGWPEDPADWEPEHVLSVEIATDLLWRRTAGRYGLCPELIRPCRRGCTPDGYGTGFLFGGSLLNPYQDGQGRWFNFGCGCGPEDCSCSPMCVLELPGPVNTVLEVKIDGEVVDPATYRLDRRPQKGKLIRSGGTSGPCWPTCQDLTKDDTEVGTFSVLYLRGQAVPVAGQRALGSLACEIYKQCTGASGCRLPERIRSVTREGITYDMFDPGEWLETGLTGLRDVDTWLRAVNPHALHQPSAVFSLDLPAAPQGLREGFDS